MMSYRKDTDDTIEEEEGHRDQAEGFWGGSHPSKMLSRESHKTWTGRHGKCVLFWWWWWFSTFIN